MGRVGILGGTFDPIHYGHLAVVEEVRWWLGLDYVLMLPAAQQPLKARGHHATPPQRLDMVRLACQYNPALRASEAELHRDPPSYTVETLHRLQQEASGPQEWWFILGADALMSLPEWKEPQQIIEMARLAVVQRPGHELDLAWLEGALPGVQQRSTVITGPLLDISSSNLRERIAQGQPVRYQLPDDVLVYIQRHRLYLTQGHA